MLLWTCGANWEHTWYFVSRVLQTPVSNIMATRKGTAVLAAIAGDDGWEGRRRGCWEWLVFYSMLIEIKGVIGSVRSCGHLLADNYRLPVIWRWS